MFDAFLLQQGATSMLDARDAMHRRRPDALRRRQDHEVMWTGLRPARHGQAGQHPVRRLRRHRAQLRLRRRASNVRVKFRPGKGQVYVGDYEARATPVADTDKKTKLKNKMPFAPGRYRMTLRLAEDRLQAVHADGRAGKKAKSRSGEEDQAPKKNFAAAAGGAKVIGVDRRLAQPGVPHRRHREHQLGRGHRGERRHDQPVRRGRPGRRGRVKIDRVQVSAMLNPAPAEPESCRSRPTRTPARGSRRCASSPSRLREELHEATAKWKRVYTSKAERVPGHRAATGGAEPDAALLQAEEGRQGRSSPAGRPGEPVHRVPAYAGEQENDPTHDTDCEAASDRGTIVHAAELQVFGKVLQGEARPDPPRQAPDGPGRSRGRTAPATSQQRRSTGVSLMPERVLTGLGFTPGSLARLEMVGRIPVMDVMPVVDLGRQPAKATVGEPMPVSASVFREGHDKLGAEVVLTGPDGVRRDPVRMTKHGEVPGPVRRLGDPGRRRARGPSRSRPGRTRSPPGSTPPASRSPPASTST